MRRANQEWRRFRPGVGRLEDRSLLSTFTVTNLADDGAGSLRRAVSLSNLTPGADTIHFAPGLTGEIHLTSGELALSDDVSITGPGANVLSLTGNTDRIFDVEGVSAAITKLTLQNGAADNGGAIRNLGGNLRTAFDKFINNTAQFAGGAVWNFTGNYASQDDTFLSNQAVFGGAVENGGRLTMQDDSFIANDAAAGGGAVSNARIVDFFLPSPTATITHSDFTANTAAAGGAVFNSSGSSITLERDNFTRNSAIFEGGALENGLHAGGGDNAIVSDSTFTGNTAGFEGGAIKSQANLILTQSTLEFNTAAVGGAVWALAGTFTPIGNTIQFNSTPEVFLA